MLLLQRTSVAANFIPSFLFNSGEMGCPGQNLSDSVDNVGLQELFKPFGNTLSCKVVTLEDGKSKGYGFVQLDSDESANAAIEKLNGSNVGGKQLYVVLFPP